MHMNPCNRSTADLVLLHTFESPFIGAAERYVETLACYVAEGRDVRGDLPPLVAMAVFAGRDQQTFGPWLSRGLQAPSCSRWPSRSTSAGSSTEVIDGRPRPSGTTITAVAPGGTGPGREPATSAPVTSLSG